MEFLSLDNSPLGHHVGLFHLCRDGVGVGSNWGGSRRERGATSLAGKPVCPYEAGGGFSLLLSPSWLWALEHTGDPRLCPTRAAVHMGTETGHSTFLLKVHTRRVGVLPAHTGLRTPQAIPSHLSFCLQGPCRGVSPG